MARASEQRMKPVTIENTRIGFRNFAGKEGKYNREGDRNFAVFIDTPTAQAMERDGWNIKWLPAREEGDTDQAILTVKVKYSEKSRPPRVVLITARGRTEIGESEINILDWAEIRNVDMILNPYQWDVNGNQGVTAYLGSIYVTIEEDELSRKYADIPNAPDSAQNLIPEDLDGPPWS